MIDVGDVPRTRATGSGGARAARSRSLSSTPCSTSSTGSGPIRAFSGLTWNERLSEDLPEQLTVISYGGLGQLRGLSRHGRLDVVPCHYSAIPAHVRLGRAAQRRRAWCRSHHPDHDGTVTLGTGVEYVADAIPHTRTLIAEINQQMPRTIGGPRLPLSAFAAFIETDRPLREAPSRAQRTPWTSESPSTSPRSSTTAPPCRSVSAHCRRRSSSRSPATRTSASTAA